MRLKALEEADAPALPAYKWLIRSQARYPIFAIMLDGVWISLAYYSAYLIRWDASELPAELPYLQRTVLIYVGIKLVGFVLSGIYDMRWTSFGLFDGMRMIRANIFATLLAVGVLFLMDRVGLSRGVIAVDLFVCALLTIGGRLSFKMIEGTAQHFSEDGVPVVILATEEHAKVAMGQLRFLHDPKLRAVAVADPALGTARARTGALPLYGGSSALKHALEETMATAVLLVGRAGKGHPHLTSHLETHGGVDAYSLRVTVEPVRAPPPVSDDWKRS